MAEKSEWTDELKQQVIEAYEEKEPTPENTLEIIKELSEEYGKTVNGIRMILSRAGVYVKKTEASSSSSKSTSSGDGPKRVNKAEAISALKSKIEAMGQSVDDDILDRLTGKAAVYFKSVLDSVK